jgi:hypothetical protein
MAPEQLDGAGQSVSPRTDVYLLGATIYETIAGHPPHRGDTVHEIMNSIAQSTPVFPDDAPEELVEICRKAMRKDPADRFASVAELQSAVQIFLQHRHAVALAQRAATRLRRLRRIAAELDPRSTADRLRLASLYSECRFAYRESLSSWSDNKVARKGLVELSCLMIHWELRAGNTEAANSLLAEMGAEPPAEIREKVDKATRARKQELDRMAQLEREHDARAGEKSRGLLVFTVVPLWSLSPLFISRMEQPSNQLWLLYTAAMLLVIAATSLALRKDLLATVYNRSLLGTLIATLAVQLVATAGFSSLGVPLEATRTLHITGWALAAGVVGLIAEPRFLVASCAFCLAFLTSAWNPPLRPIAITLAHLVLAAVLVRCWPAIFCRSRPDAAREVDCT